jgi:hypothetical protein
MWVLALSAFNRNRYSEWAGEQHVGDVGTEVHGLGTISVQNADAVAITGGDADALALTGLRRVAHDAPQVLANGAVWDWAATPTHNEMAPTGTIPSIANASAGEMKRINVTGAGSITITGATWATGHPTWGTTGTLVNIIASSSVQFIATSIPY